MASVEKKERVRGLLADLEQQQSEIKTTRELILECLKEDYRTDSGSSTNRCSYETGLLEECLALRRLLDSAQEDVITAYDKTGLARNGVFDTVELLEKILLCLPMRDLIAAQRVNKQFRSVIKGSKPLRTELFMTPDVCTGPTAVRLNPLLFAMPFLHKIRMIVQLPDLQMCGGKLSTDTWRLTLNSLETRNADCQKAKSATAQLWTVDDRDCPMDERKYPSKNDYGSFHVDMQYFRQYYTGPVSHGPRKQSWRSMYLTQPVCGITFTTNNSNEIKKTIYTIGEMTDRLEEIEYKEWRRRLGYPDACDFAQPKSQAEEERIWQIIEIGQRERFGYRRVVDTDSDDEGDRIDDVVMVGRYKAYMKRRFGPNIFKRTWLGDRSES